jgi:xanthine/uracil/vitamin C permease (AzgA family)
MNKNALLAGVGLFLAIVGFVMTDISGPMPGSTLKRPATFRDRAILVVFGLFMFALGAYRYFKS